VKENKKLAVLIEKKTSRTINGTIAATKAESFSIVVFVGDGKYEETFRASKNTKIIWGDKVMNANQFFSTKGDLIGVPVRVIMSGDSPGNIYYIEVESTKSK
jgi:hypothetical protein